MSFPRLPTGYPFPALELDVLEQWRRERTFAASLEKTRDGDPFVFYEGPPTANNKPHVGHVLTRVVKDLFPRFQTMRGRHVARKAGWDTHGLPVEIEVEKALGFSGKQDIEDYGVAEFNAKCLESVHTYERQWREMSERVGYWIDFDDAYFTYRNRYIESAWWALKRLWEQDLLYQDYKIQPYCARCGTTLSSHEVAQNYQETDDPSIWVLFPVPANQPPRQTVDGGEWTIPDRLAMVAWTTTPWTVLANVALAVNPSLTYKVVEHPGEPDRHLLFADGLEQPVPVVIEIDGKHERLDLRQLEPIVRIAGEDLQGLLYERPFRLRFHQWGTGGTAPFKDGDEAQPPTELRPVFTGDVLVGTDFVTAAEGTGIVHIATYGEDDDRVIRRLPNRPRVFSVREDGKIRDDEEETRETGFAGRWFKEADPDIARELKRRGLLLHLDRHRHNYPFCWRCDQPLLYFPARSWFIRTTARRDDLLAANRRISWHPDHVGDGRFGRWIEGGVDWALSRTRYWGTPLPVWRCLSCGEHEVIGSFEELFRKAGKPLPTDPYDREQFDPHRPFIDTPQVATPQGLDTDELEALSLDERPFAWRCENELDGEACGGIVARVTDVIDAWFDSGAMPFAQHHYPFENQDLFAPTSTAPAATSGVLAEAAALSLMPDAQSPSPGSVADARGFPADFISEAVDQTRGWFYTLHALGVLLFDSEAYRNCIVMGHVNDEEGRKMSKRLGNVVDPMEVVPETGADAMRWYFYVNNPEASARFSARLVREAAQRFLIPIWNAVSFFTIYANLDGWAPPPGQERVERSEERERPALDRWVLARLDATVDAVTAALEAYEIAPAARALETFVDDLTNWYIRRSRDRFWAGTQEASAEKESAYQALYETLTTLARLLAPFTPFLAEVLHRHLVRSQFPDAESSVHLEDWPAARDVAAELVSADEGAKEDGRDELGRYERGADAELLVAMADVQRIVRLGRAARSTHELKVRQPLAAVTLVTSDPGLRERVEPYLDILRDELNVHDVEWAERRTEYVHHEVRPVFPRLGPRFGKRMPALKAALEAADGDLLARQLETEGHIVLELDGESVELAGDEVAVRLIEREGLATAGDTDLLVALDTALSDELITEGWAREVVHRIQTARKEADLDYAARIRVRYRADDRLAAAIDAHRDWIAGETLAVELTAGDAASDLKVAPVEGHEFAFAVEVT